MTETTERELLDVLRDIAWQLKFANAMAYGRTTWPLDTIVSLMQTLDKRKEQSDE